MDIFWSRKGTDTKCSVIMFTAWHNATELQCQSATILKNQVLSVRFAVGVSLLLAPAGADKRGPKAPCPLVENARIQPAISKRVPARAPAGAGSY